MTYRNSLLASVWLGVMLAPSAAPEPANAQAAPPAVAVGGSSPTGSGAVNAGTVSAAGQAPAAASPSSTVLTPAQRQRSSQAVTSIDKSQVNLVGPQASGLQSLTLAPGVSVNGYSASTGSARSTLSVRGVKVGWNSVPGDLETNGLTAEFDGVPLNSLIQGTGWHSTEVPLGLLLAGTNLIYGPGNPRERWYDSLGGTVNFIPVQPALVAGGSLSASYGSFGSQAYSGIFNTGEHDGWSGVLGFAHTYYDTFRKGVDSWPSTGDQVYAKIRHRYATGHFSVGFYWQHSDEFRPNMVPTEPVPGLTLAGQDGNAPLYSQKTSGYYSDLPRSVWFKHNQIENFLGYTKLTQKLGSRITLHNVLWYRHGAVTHYRVNSLFPPGNPTGSEYYYPTSDTVGDKLYADFKLTPDNTLSVGGYAIGSHTVNRLDLYNYTLGTTQVAPGVLAFNTYDNANLAAFAQDNITLFQRLHIVPGIELVNYHTAFYNNNAEAGLSAPNASFDNHPHTTKDFTRVEPSLGLTFDILPWLTAYGNTAVTYQNPTGGNFNKGQADLTALKPVKSQDYEIGLRAVRPGLLGFGHSLMDVNYFRDHISDQTIPVSLASNPAVTTFGYGSATLQGVNAEISTDLGFPWRVFANGEYLDANWDSFLSTTTNSNYNGFPVSNSPVLTGNFGVRYRRLVGDTLVSGTLYDQYVGRRYLFSNLDGAPTKRRITPYNILNLTLTADIPIVTGYVPAFRTAKLSFFATNLLGRRYNSTEYISSGGYFGGNSTGAVLANPGPPRAFYGSLSITF